MMRLKTHLISGAGNTFHVLFDEAAFFSSAAISAQKRKEISAQICQKNPADGFIFLERGKNSSYRWHFYNNDGSDAEMCGNATRCVGFYIKNILLMSQKSWQLETVAGLIEIQESESAAELSQQFKVIMTAPRELSSSQGFFCDTGVPHLVLPVEELSTDASVKEAARALRFHTEFQPRGTNVTYVELQAETNRLKAVSYERGVEDFTAACGTGAMAAALFNLRKRGASESLVEMPGGTLMMNLLNLQRPTMTGPAVLMGSYQYEFEI